LDIYRRLTLDHAWQRELAILVLETRRDDPVRARLYRLLKSELESHAEAEERTLYGLLLCLPNCHLQARRAIHGHQRVADQLRALEEVDMASDEWLRRFCRLSDDIEGFSCAEEEFLFPAVRESLDHVTAVRMTDEYAQRKSASAVESVDVTPWPTEYLTAMQRVS
jgi:hemerythrin superfamily protein